MYTDEDGMVVIRGRLPQEVAAVVEKALEAAMDLLREEEKTERTDGNDSAESSDTPRDGVMDDSAESRPLENFAQRRVDALELLAEAALGEGLGKTERGEPYQVMIHVDSDILADRSQEGLAELGTGDGISAESCRRLACDAPQRGTHGFA